MELKDIVLAAIEDIQQEEEIQNLNQPKKQTKQPIKQTKQKPIKVNKIKKIDTNLSEEQFLKKLKERVLVLFEGFNSPRNKNIEAKLDITLNFLEYLLSLTDERLQNIDKSA
jgi:hypothetical protein